MKNPVIAFFNNKGGVGKTSLVFHLAAMYADVGKRVLAVDLDPQANLTGMFLDDDDLDEIWPDEPAQRKSILGVVHPLIAGTGDVGKPAIREWGDNVGLLPGDIGLSKFEDALAEAWPKCFGGDERSFRVLTAFHRRKSRLSGPFIWAFLTFRFLLSASRLRLSYYLFVTSS